MRPSESFSVEHGHPTCCLINGKPATMPVSFVDYKTSIWWHGAEDVIAYDVNGKFSMLRRKPNFRRLSAKEIEYYDNLQMKICDEVYLPKMLEHLPKEFHTATSGKQLRNIYNTLKQNGKLTKDLDTQFQKAFNELNSESPELLLKIDKFWRTYADDLGVIYKSNYEYLKTSTANKSSDFLNALFSDESINFDLLMKISNYLVKNAKNVRNINIIKEAYFKRDFATLEKICSRNLKTINSTNKIAKEDLVKQINQEFANKKKIDVNTLTDSEVHNLAKLFGTTEEQIRHMDKKEFRRLCLQYHPDRNQNDSMSSQIFIILNKIFPG